ncbi:MAG: hypothetical protein DI536_28935 [Archangium gephyra]|uniref:Uncharacterized protein n=1 Tax=Archangium gephyra TaxID=48 RepID=A0A2W5UUR9_9BACT|nr:MAG: hypothetical protein DI536_28935 [Archangium gephyra]
MNFGALIRWGLVAFAVLVALPALAQAALPVDPHKLVDDMNTKALATVVVVLLFVVWRLYRDLHVERNARVSDLKEFHAVVLQTNTAAVTLGLKMADGLDALDKAADRLARQS